MVSSVAYNSKIPLKIQIIVEFLMLIREMDDTQWKEEVNLKVPQSS